MQLHPFEPQRQSLRGAFIRPTTASRVSGILSLAALAAAIAVPAAAQKAPALPPLLDTMTTELNRAMADLGKSGRDKTSPGNSTDKQPPPYFLSYSVADATNLSIRAQYGALVDSSNGHQRVVDVQVRVGQPKLDNTHGTHRSSAVNTVQLPVTDDRQALSRSLWLATNAGYSTALDNFLRVKTESEVRAKEEDASGDFSTESAQVSVNKPAPDPVVEKAAWEERVRNLSKIFREYPDVYQNIVMLTAQSETDYFTSSEGSRIAAPHQSARLIVFAVSRAEDGMDLFRAQTFEAETVAGLPKQAELETAMRELGKSLEALRKAPLTEPFNGPAILSGRAAAVFFHEVLGHRLEGQRQRGDEEGQTFTKEIGKPILPSFLSVADDPTRARFGDTWLSGTYDYDDEGQKARKVDLIQDGVLKTFLMSRLPIASFQNSNGHGRGQTGRVPNGRQGNLIVTSTKMVPETELRKMLIEEAKKQNKPYGLYFEDISSGFAVTTRNSPQAFSVIPLVVYRVYVDGRPDELVRGVSIVGTPLAAMKRILATGDKSEVFNGECGAESGSIPVSAVAPAMLLTEIETQKQQQGTERVPILSNPSSIASNASNISSGKGN
jgi:TldD protein